MGATSRALRALGCVFSRFFVLASKAPASKLELNVYPFLQIQCAISMTQQLWGTTKWNTGQLLLAKKLTASVGPKSCHAGGWKWLLWSGQIFLWPSLSFSKAPSKNWPNVIFVFSWHPPPTLAIVVKVAKTKHCTSEKCEHTESMDELTDKTFLPWTWAWEIINPLGRLCR